MQDQSSMMGILPICSCNTDEVLHNDRQEEYTHNTPIQQGQETDSRTNMSDGKPDCVTKSDTPKTMIMESGQNSTKGETRTR